MESPGDVLCKLGPITIRYYGVMIALGFIAASQAATRLAKQLNVDSEKIVNMALLCFIGGVIGARLYYVALKWSMFQNHLSEILFSPTEGFSLRGLAIHGGIFGAVAVGVFYCWRSKMPIMKSCDIITACLPLGQAIGRWGNFFNSEAFGAPCDPNYFLRLRIPPDHRPTAFTNFEYFHPTFLYESVWDLMLFLLLYFVAIKRLQKLPGLTFCIYIFGYSVGRLLIESMRTDSVMMPGTAIAAPTLISGALIFLAMAGAGAILYKHRNPEPEAEKPA